MSTCKCGKTLISKTTDLLINGSSQPIALNIASLVGTPKDILLESGQVFSTVTNKLNYQIGGGVGNTVIINTKLVIDHQIKVVIKTESGRVLGVKYVGSFNKQTIVDSIQFSSSDLIPYLTNDERLIIQFHSICDFSTSDCCDKLPDFTIINILNTFCVRPTTTTTTSTTLPPTTTGTTTTDTTTTGTTTTGTTTTGTTTTGTTTTGTTTTGTTTTGTTTTGTTTTGTTTTGTTTTGTTTTGTTTTGTPTTTTSNGSTTTGTPGTTTSGGGTTTETPTTTTSSGGFQPGDPPISGGVGGCESIGLCDKGDNICCPCAWDLDVCGCVPPNCECVFNEDYTDYDAICS